MHTVVMVPSLGRPASDFDDLAFRLRDAGFRTLQIDPPRALPGEPTLHDLAALVVAEVENSGVHQFHLIGHAFGNRLSRMVTHDYPDKVLSLTLLAAGGYVEIEEDVLASLMGSFDESLDEHTHMSHVAAAFFAPGNDPTPWRDGWMRDVMVLQQKALARVSRSDWWDATAPRVLVVQARQDRIAPVANGEKYAADHPEITTLAYIDGAGHAMLPEKPAEIASTVIEFLKG